MLNFQYLQRLKYSKCYVYQTKYKLYKYNDDFCRLVKINSQRGKGFEDIEEKHFKGTEGESERVSLSRTKRNIREIALSNNFEYFATVTVNSKNADRFSLDECQDLLRKKFKKLKRINKDFAYIFITEKHKDGAFHFHGLVKGIEEFYVNQNGYLSHKILDEVGFNSFSKINDYIKCCNYITKYITKDCVRNTAGYIYISSRGLKKADVYDYDVINFEDWSFENDYCKIKDFKISEMPKELLYQLMGVEKNE